MKETHRKLYVGIDVHSKEHKVVIMPVALLQRLGNNWKRVKPLNIKNNVADFDRLDSTIRLHISSAKEAAIAVDHTGGHYSEPIVYFLQAKGYDIYYLETKAVKAARERFLDQENKNDKIDSISAAYLLYLRDLHGLSFRISAVIPELGSKAATLKSLVLQRWQFSKLAIQATNRLHQLLLAVFPEGEVRYFNQLLKIIPDYPTPEDILASDGLESVQAVNEQIRANIVQLASETVGIPSEKYRWLIRELSLQRIDSMAKRELLTNMMRKEVVIHPYSQILFSFPHVGEICAATIIAIVKDINRWPDKKKFKKTLGIYNNLVQSGSNPAKTRRGTEGSREGRRVLFQVCFGCIRALAPENDFRDYYSRHVARGKPRKKALFATMGKLAEIIYHCLKFGEPYQYQGKYRIGIINGAKKP